MAKKVRKMRSAFSESVGEEYRHPSSLKTRGKEQNSLFQGSLKAFILSYSLKDLRQIDPIDLLQRISFDCQTEIVKRFLFVDAADIPLIEESQAVEWIRIQRGNLKGLQKYLFRRTVFEKIDPSQVDRISRPKPIQRMRIER
jgi:hypothetical protein